MNSYLTTTGYLLILGSPGCEGDYNSDPAHKWYAEQKKLFSKAYIEVGRCEVELGHEHYAGRLEPCIQKIYKKYHPTESENQ